MIRSEDSSAHEMVTKVLGPLPPIMLTIEPKRLSYLSMYSNLF